MLLRPLSYTAALVAVTTAFLIPTDVSVADDDNTHALPFTVPKIAESQKLNLNCPGCPMQMKNHHGASRMNQGVENHLELNFSIDHAASSDRLLLNGFELYPNAEALTSTLTAPQIPDFKSEKGAKAPKPHRMLAPCAPRLGFSLHTYPVAMDTQDKMSLVALDLQIIEIGNTFVDGIPNVNIKLIRTEEGALMLGDIKTTESQTAQANPMDPQSECTTLMCKWKAIVSEQLNHMKPHKCGKMGKAHHKGTKNKGHHHHHNHHHHQSDRPSRFQLHEHKWGQLFKQFGSHILFPVLVGIVAGISVSIVGMIVGTLIVGLWRVLVRGQPFFHRRRRHSVGHSHHKAAQKEAAVAEEKSGLLDQDDVPPSYEDQPDAEA